MAKGKSKVKSQKSKVALIKAELPSGFRDYRPEDAIARGKMLATIRKTFEDFGFDPMETPAVERTEILTGGEAESSKIIFNVKGSRESLDKARDKQKSDTSLRFDLTVPLARFLAANPEIPKPFKRYQIGNVWRGESPQAGRYREFMQADIDIVGSSSMAADSEIVSALYTTLKNLGLKKVLIKINNRKILNELPRYAGFPEKKLFAILRLIDKKDKIGESGIVKEIQRQFSKKVADKVLEFLRAPQKDSDGQRELDEIAQNLKTQDVNFEIDYSVVRGLGYYTGPVFEAILPDAPELGSIAGGGRYDNLMLPFTGQKIPAVGVSIGVDRLLAVLEKLNLLTKKATTTRILILNLSENLREEYLDLAEKLRNASINTSLYLGDDTAFQAQLAYAVKKEIPYVVIFGDREKEKNIISVKNLITREQKEVPKEKLIEFLK